jgi:hypothetical protein
MVRSDSKCMAPYCFLFSPKYNITNQNIDFENGDAFPVPVEH